MLRREIKPTPNLHKSRLNEQIIIKPIYDNENKFHKEDRESEDRTPPEPAATAGAMRTLAFFNASIASGVQGIFEPRKTTIIHNY